MGLATAQNPDSSSSQRAMGPSSAAAGGYVPDLARTGRGRRRRLTSAAPDLLLQRPHREYRCEHNDERGRPPDLADARDLAAQGRRRDPRHRREVRRQPGHRHRLADRADRRPARAAPASARSSRSPTTPAPATARSASAGASRSRRSPARPTRACRGTATPTSPTSSSSPAPRTSCRCSTADGDAVRGRHAPRPGFVDPPLPPAHRGAVRPHRALDRRRRPATSTGARSRRDNVTTLYGTDTSSRIADPPTRPDPRRVFSWLICESYDDKGNAIVYEYKRRGRRAASTCAQAHERNRTDAGRTANRYLKRIRYGNRVSRLVQPDLRRRRLAVRGRLRLRRGPLRRRVDPRPRRHGEHDVVRAAPRRRAAVAGPPRPVLVLPRRLRGAHLPPLPARADVPPLPDEPGVGADCLVRSTDFDYATRYARPTPTTSWPSGSTRSRRSSRRSPSRATRARRRRRLRCTRSRCRRSSSTTARRSSRTSVRELDADEPREPARRASTAPATSGSTSTARASPGILTEQAGAWFYKPNLGDGRFGPLADASPRKPSLAALSERPPAAPRPRRRRPARPGRRSPARRRASTSARTDDGWEPFRPFTPLPNVDWDDPNLRFVDLDGDGHADVLITEDDAFTWYPSLGEDGLRRRPSASRRPLDEERGPAARLRRRHAVDLPRRHVAATA